MSPRPVSPEEVLDFWFGAPPDGVTPARRELWFGKNSSTDEIIRVRFAATHEEARQGRLNAWLMTSHASLAFILVTDQFPRNMFRGLPGAFATDALALGAARQALAEGFDRGLRPVQRAFVYLPFEHSEDAADQTRAVALFQAMRAEPDMEGFYRYALAHQRIIERFGRFPHRNAILGRASTVEETQFLREPGSRF
jgi:uncharacterized protein (DUF924 family)